MTSFPADLRSFCRTLRRQPALSTAVITILALGIASTVVVYGVVEALVLDPFPYPEPDRLVLVGSEMPRAGRELGFFERLSGPEIEDIRIRGRTLERLLPFDLNSVRVRGDEYPERLFALFAGGDPFVTLGVRPRLGRGFTADEVRRGAPVAVISYPLWQRRFGADPEVLGRTLVADGVSYAIGGVAPRATTIYGAELWLPLPEPIATLPRERRHFNLLARIVPGADLEQVGEDLEAVADGVARELGGPGGEGSEYGGWRLAATTWTRFNAFAYDAQARLALGAIVFVLLLVCANLASLLLTRAAGRRREMAVRLALGAGRGRILRQVATETGLFALGGGLLGVLLAFWGLDAASAWLPAALQPGAKPIALDRETWLFAGVVTLAAAVVCGLAPTLHLAGGAPREVLGAGGRSSPGRAARRTLRGFVIAQVAAAVVLLVGAATLVTAWADLARRELGFDVEGLLSMRLSLPRGDYDGDAVPRFFASLQEEVATLPGVRSVTLASQVAPSTFFGAQLHFAGTPTPPTTEAAEIAEAVPRPFHTVVGDGYFRTLGLELLRGRPLGEEDRLSSLCALVINQLAAERYFPGQDPLGRRGRVVGSRFDSGNCEIVGISAAASQRGPAQPPAPEVFTSHRQAGGRFNQMFLVVRAAGDPAALVAPIRARVRDLDPEQPVYAIGTAEEVLASQLAPRRVTAQLLAAYAATALGLSTLGLYGVLAYGVARRRREMGLRMALGALRRDLMRLILREALGTVGVGLAIGVAGALAAARLLRHQLMEVAEPDLWMLVGPALLLLVTACLAAVLPARRAGRVAPASVLRDS